MASLFGQDQSQSPNLSQLLPLILQMSQQQGMQQRSPNQAPQFPVGPSSPQTFSPSIMPNALQQLQQGQSQGGKGGGKGGGGDILSSLLGGGGKGGAGGLSAAGSSALANPAYADALASTFGAVGL